MTALHLNEQYSVVRVDDETLIVNIPADKVTGREARKVRVPLNKITRVNVHGNITLTTPAIVALLNRHVEITYLTRFGGFQGRISGEEHKFGQLRLIQRRAHDDPSTMLYIARMCVRSKLHNQRTLLLRSNRTRNHPKIEKAAALIGALIERIDQLPSEDIAPPNPTRPQSGTILGKLMGIEGKAATAYFSVFGLLFPDEWSKTFPGRRKRPPTDPINSMLSFGYTLLTSRMTSAVYTVGFDPYVGYLHSTQYGNPALALDLVEMFRAPVVDSVVLTMINNRMIKLDDFEMQMGGCRMNDEPRKHFLQKYEERLQETITHPYLKTKVSYERCLELQARLLSRWMLGELHRFREFHMR